MNKKDVTQPLDRKNQQRIQEPHNLVHRASDETLKNRKIFKLKPFDKSGTTKTTPTSAVFNISNDPKAVKSGPVSGQVGLEKKTGSNSFFKQGMKSGISGDFTLKPTSGSLDFFTGKKQLKDEKKEEVKTKADIEKTGENKLLGNFVAKNGIGEGMFANEKQEPEKPKTQTSFFGNMQPNAGVKNSLFAGLGQNKNPEPEKQESSKETNQSLFSNLGKPKTTQEVPNQKEQKPAQEAQKEAGKNAPDSKDQFPIDQTKFKSSLTKPLFDKPLFGNTQESKLFSFGTKPSSSGLFSSLKTKTDGNGSLFSGGLFSKLDSGTANSFFQNTTNQGEDDETDKEQQEKEESVDPKKVKMIVEYESAYNTLASSLVRDFKEQPVGGPSPDSGFGSGSVSLEMRKTGEGDKSKDAGSPKVVMFVYRNQAKLVKHESMLIGGVSWFKLLKSRKDGIILLTFKNCVKSGQAIKYWVKVLFNEDKEAEEFLEKLKENCK